MSAILGDFRAGRWQNERMLNLLKSFWRWMTTPVPAEHYDLDAMTPEEVEAVIDRLSWQANK